MDLDTILTMDSGPERTAALVAWFQGFFDDRSKAPVLVGGAAVELYTGGAYVTGDLDFVGYMTDSVAERLQEEGFRRKGRHWVHEKGGVFIEIPAHSFDRVVRVDSFRLGERMIRILSPEDMLVDRLAAWRFWKSSLSGVNAYLIWRERGDELDLEWLARLAKLEHLEEALESLENFASSDRTPSEVERWARASR